VDGILEGTKFHQGSWIDRLKRTFRNRLASAPELAHVERSW